MIKTQSIKSVVEKAIRKFPAWETTEFEEFQGEIIPFKVYVVGEEDNFLWDCFPEDVGISNVEYTWVEGHLFYRPV